MNRIPKVSLLKQLGLCAVVTASLSGCGGTESTSDELEAALDRIEELETAQQEAGEAPTNTTTTAAAPTTTAAAPTTTAAAPTTTTAAPTTTTTTVPVCNPSWSAAPDVTAGWPSAAFSAPGRSLQEEVRIGTHPGYDRFLVEFEEGGRTPNGWSVSWISGTPLHDGSGEPVDIAGNEFLEVRYLGSAGWVTYPEAWYQGPQEFFGTSVGTANLVEAEMAGDYEGYVTWYVSADTAGPFNVFTLSNPPRLVVDICH